MVTEQEINTLLDTLIEKFRAFVAEEVQKYYKSGKPVPSQEISNLLRAFEANEMTQMFNTEKIPQNAFRIFLQRYLRVWFDSLSEKIANNFVEADNIEDLPTDGSVKFAVIDGVPYFWNGEKWVKLLTGVPEYNSLDDLPTDGSIEHATIDGRIYYWNGNEWVEVTSPEQLPDDGSISFAGINGVPYLWNGEKWVKVLTGDEIQEIYDIISKLNSDDNSGDSDSDSDNGETYHNTVLEIVNEFPAMNVGDRYLLDISSGSEEVTFEGFKTIQNGIISKSPYKYVNAGNLFVLQDKSALWSGGNSDPNYTRLIYSRDNSPRYVTGYTGTIANNNLGMDSIVEFAGNVYFIAGGKVYILDRDTASATPLKIGGTELTSAAPYFHKFEDKLFFNSGSGETARFSYIDQSGTVNAGTLFSVASLNFAHVSAVYNGKLHIIGSAGLYLINSGEVLPYKVDGTFFDTPGIRYTTVCVFNNKLYAGSYYAYTAANLIVAWDGNTGTACVDGQGFYTNQYTFISHIAEYGGNLYAVNDGELTGDGFLWKLSSDNVFVRLREVPITDYNGVIWQGKYLFDNVSLREIDLDTLELKTHLTRGNNVRLQDGNTLFRLIIESTGQYSVQEYVIEKTQSDPSDSISVIKIVGKDAGGEYEEPFEEGHRVVVKDSPTGFSREYGIRDDELIDTDGDEQEQADWNVTDSTSEAYIKNKPENATQSVAGFMSSGDKTKLDGIEAGAKRNVQSDWNQTTSTADDFIKNKPEIPPDLSNEVAALQSITTIRGNVDTYAHLLAIATAGMRAGDSYIVEADENNAGNSAIYTWDGTNWNFTHLWKVEIGNLNTNNTTEQTASGSESFSGTIKLHKISKTGKYSDLSGTPDTATPTEKGLMSAADKTKLDGVATGAEVNVQSDWNQATTTADDYIKNKPTIPTIPGNATTSAAGLMSSGDKTKLDGIASSANNYTLPTATSTVKGGIELASDTVQTVAANAVTATAGKTYGVQLNNAGQAVVNVPWTDNNTTYSDATTSAAGLMSAADKTKLDGIKLWKGTEAEYDSISKDSSTIYMIFSS